jgi:predicted ABC-type ATPase
LPKIYIIAGPPGVGKSTSGGSMIPEDTVILDPDQIANRYKTQGFSDYKDIGNLKFNELVKKELFSGKHFGIELNLGFETHYDFVQSLKIFNSDNTIEIILFFTDDISLCYQRAELRYRSGLHYVESEIIKEMYENTIPLLHTHFSMINSLIAVNVTSQDIPKICLKYSSADQQLIVAESLPDWAEKPIKEFVELQFKQKQLMRQSQQQVQKRIKAPGKRFRP